MKRGGENERVMANFSGAAAGMRGARQNQRAAQIRMWETSEGEGDVGRCESRRTINGESRKSG